MAWNDDLVGPALEFARSDARMLRALAGPGTGKTRALLRRLARLIEGGWSASEILVVTFARTAAQDIVSKLEALGDEAVRGVRARTLHSYCFSVIAGEGFLAATGRNPRILLEFERDFLLMDLVGPFSHKLTDRRELTNAFEAAWARLQPEEPGAPVDGLDQAFQEALLGSLRWHRAMLIGEVVPLALSYLRHNPHAPERVAYAHLLVDEYQDLNKAEQVLIDILTQEGNLAVIGDDDQSIYGFKYANPDGIRRFPESHENTRDVQFVECWRCPRAVVELAQTFINHNPGRVRAPLAPKPDNPLGEIYDVQWRSIEDEAQGIAEFIQHHVQGGMNPGQCLVMSPSRKIGYAIRDAVQARDIPIKSFFREQAVEGEAGQEKLALLTLLANPDDRTALRAWIGLKSSGGLVGSYRHLQTAARAAGTGVREILERLDRGQVTIPFSAKPRARWKELQSWLEELQPFAEDLNLLVSHLLPETAEGDDELALLRRIAQGCVGEAESIQEFADAVRYGISQPEVPLETPYARVMSLHKSKGLTAELVVIAGVVEGLIPRFDPDASDVEQQAQLEEQRRLFFVGMTRTTRILVFSGYSQLPDHVVHRLQVRHGRRVGNNFVTFVSSFLGEVGPTLPAAIRGEDWITGLP